METTSAPDISALHRDLIDNLKERELIKTPRIEAAFRDVPRHLFLPEVDLERVYSDEAIPTKKLASGEAISSSSQPAIMAIMLEQLDLKPGHRVLEIGAGTGYNAALMAHIVGETGQVITIDLDEDIVVAAREHLAAAGFHQVQVLCRDGVTGYLNAAPYDRIILTVGSWDIASAWQEQLKPEGRLVLPFNITGFMEKAVAFEKVDNHLVSTSLEACGFMKLRGDLAAETEIEKVQLGPEPGLSIYFEAGRSVDFEAIYQWLTGPSKDWPTAVQTTWSELHKKNLQPLLASDQGLQPLFTSNICRLIAVDTMAERDLVPPFFILPGKWRFTAGLLGEAGLGVLMVPPDQLPFTEEANHTTPFPLYVRSFGPDDTMAQQLIELMNAWDAAGRPTGEIARLRVYPSGIDYTPTDDEFVICKQWTKVVIEWATKI